MNSENDPKNRVTMTPAFLSTSCTSVTPQSTSHLLLLSNSVLFPLIKSPTPLSPPPPTFQQVPFIISLHFTTRTKIIARSRRKKGFKILLEQKNQISEETGQKFQNTMATLQDFCCLRKVLPRVILIALVFITSSMLFSTSSSLIQPQGSELFGRRRLLEVDDDDGEEQPIKKKISSRSSSTLSSNNQIKILRTTSGLSKNQTKHMKPLTSSTKNQTEIPKLQSDFLVKKNNKTKLIKPTSDSAKENPTIKSQFKKLNSTSKLPTLSKNTTSLIKKSSDLSKKSSPKNKTAKPTSQKEIKILRDKNLDTDSTTNSNSKTPIKKQTSNQKPKSEKVNPKQTLPSWIIEEDDDDDLVSGFRGLPSKFQETILPDLGRISKTSQLYLNKANKEMTKGFKPYVGNRYASSISSAVSFAFIFIPLLLVSLIFNKFKAHFSLQKILISIQVYLSIYFSILCLSSLASGLEPLKFLYATSQSTYVCLQVLQTTGYVLYLLLLLMYLILVISIDTGLATKLLGLGQIFVGFAVGLHYYVMVFHRAVLHQPPKTSWRVHAIYATCFLLICVLTRADRRKKAYLEGSVGEGKMS